MKDFNHTSCNLKNEMKQTVANKLVFHYTSTDGLKAILDNGTLRFTDCQFLNDKSEYTYIEIPLRAAIEKNKDNLDPTFLAELKNIENENFQEQDMYYTDSSKRNLILKIFRFYVFCCSKKQDTLNMWNYYTKDGNYQGYNIAINVESLSDSLKESPTPKDSTFELSVSDVIYDFDKQLQMISNLLLESQNIYVNQLKQNGNDTIKASQSATANVYEKLSIYRMVFKDSSFSHEEECRFILKAQAQKNESSSRMEYKFYNRNGIFVPCYDVPISKKSTIKAITIAPMVETDLAIEGLRQHLKFEGYADDIEISKSKIPIRY